MMSILSPLIRCGTKTKCFAPNWAEGCSMVDLMEVLIVGWWG